MGKNIGLILLGLAAVALLLIAVLMFGPAEGRSAEARVLGFVLFSAAIVLPLAGAGLYFFLQGQRDAKKSAQAQKQRQLLNMIKAKGQVNIIDAVYELESDRDQVQAWLYDLVGKGLYSGYINWDDGLLYSAEAKNLRQLEQCKSCGGKLSLAGKGVVKCPYCGTDYFL